MASSAARDAGSSSPGRGQGVSKVPNGGGVKAVWRSGRAVWVLGLVAVVFLGLGFLLGGLVRSPSELAAETAPPPEGLVTARVEARGITSTVTARADVVFADPVEINPVAPEGAGAPVVTGQVPEVGAVVEAGDVVLEVSGSPVFVLPGTFKAYRSMGPGSSGPDVLQLRSALTALGFAAGNAESKVYDKALADAVKALFEGAGYPAPGSENLESVRAVRDARDAVVDAKDAQVQAVKAVTAAEKAVAEAPDAQAQAQAVEALEAARSGVTQADRSVERAREALADAEKAAWTTMPLGAVVFVADLPRRVDKVSVAVGSDLGEIGGGEVDPMGGEPGSSAAVVLSGAEIEVTAQVNLNEAVLLQAGGEATLTVGGNEVAGEIAEICPEAANGSVAGGEGETGVCAVKITVADLGEADPAELTGNVLVTMVVGVSSEDSLVVPVAAVSADTAGNARIEVVEGELAKNKAAADQKTRIVGITAGLTAEGMVEVKEADSELKVGDLVVIGRAGVVDGSSPTPDAAAKKD